MKSDRVQMVRVQNPGANQSVRFTINRAFKLHGVQFSADINGSSSPGQITLQFEKAGLETIHVGTPLIDDATTWAMFGSIGYSPVMQPVAIDPVTGVLSFSNANVNTVGFPLPNIWFPLGATIDISAVDAVFNLLSIAFLLEYED
jgi:hypothetical protein